MSEPFEIRPVPVAPSASRARGTSAISLIVLHSDPRVSGAALADYGAPDAAAAPHYYLDSAGAITHLVPDNLAALHSGLATWQRRRRNIDLISIGIVVEHTPGTSYTPEQVGALGWLLQHLRMRHTITPDSVVRWEPKDRASYRGEGVLLAFEPLLTPFQVAEPLAEPLVLGDDVLPVEDESICIPPPMPPLPEEPVPMVLGDDPGSAAVLGIETDPAAQQRLWRALQQEMFRLRGEGFRADWAFHITAARNNLGPPLSTSARAEQQVSFGGKKYGFQVFAGDTLFNEVPKWAEVQSLNALLNGSIPPSGLGRALLDAAYRAVGQVLHADWASHIRAVRDQLGPPLSGNYRISVGGQQVAVQVFARDTLYTLIASPESQTNWGDVRKLSELGDGELREALWAETYKPSGAAYQRDSSFQQFAARERLGAPLSGMYTLDFEGTPYNVQVFANGAIYSPGSEPLHYSTLTQPQDLAESSKSFVAVGSSPDPADQQRTPVFALLPVPTSARPRVSQFYGYTKYARDNAHRFYSQTQGHHSGIDIGIPTGTPLYALDHGIVFCGGKPKVDCQFGGAPPLVIVVRYGNVYAVYGHCSAVYVRKGQVVRPGDQIGLSGEYPANTPHLHFEVRPIANPSQAYNPVPYFSQDLQHSYFEPMLSRIGGVHHFCRGTYNDQPVTQFGAAINTQPCER